MDAPPSRIAVEPVSGNGSVARPPIMADKTVPPDGPIGLVGGEAMLRLSRSLVLARG